MSFFLERCNMPMGFLKGMLKYYVFISFYNTAFLSAVQGFKIIVKTEIPGTLTMAKWINRDTKEIGTFDVEKRGNKNSESNQR